MVLRAWTPVVVWIVIIMVMATDVFSGNRTAQMLYRFVTWLFPDVGWDIVGPLHSYLRKLGHLVGYAVLGALAFRAWREAQPQRQRWTAKWAVMAVGVATIVACCDETLQAFMTSRGGSMLDVLLDASGASFAQLFIRMRTRSSSTDKPGQP